MKRMITSAFICLSVLTVGAAYRTVGNGTEPNVWSANYSGIVSAAQQTGYPILLIVVNSATCGHCHTLNSLTLNSSAFRALESEETFYRLMIDQVLVSDKLCLDVWRKYSRYFNDDMYPLIAVLRKDGSVYNSYGNRVTDARNVAGDVRQWITALAKEQSAGGGGEVTPPPTPPSSTPTVADVAAKLNGKYNGVAVDSAGEMVATMAMNVTARGKATVKFGLIDGNVNVRASLVLDKDATPMVVADGLSLIYDKDVKAWRGKNGEWDVVAVASKPSSAGFDGQYTAYVTSAKGALAGYAMMTVKNGKCKVQGQVNWNKKLAANGNTLSLAVKSLYVPILKKGIVRGAAEIAADGTITGSLALSGVDMTIEGAKWDTTTPASALAGLSLVLGEDTSALRIPLVMQKNKIAAAANDYKARFSFQPKKGTFKGNANIGGKKIQFSGAMVRTADGIGGGGTAFGAGGVMPVRVE